MASAPAAKPGRPLITHFKDRRRLLGVFLILGAAFVVQGIATAIFFIQDRGSEGGLKIVAIGLALFIVWLGYWFASYAWRRRSDPEDPIVVGPAGLYDRALSEQPIAWSDIRNLHVWRGRGGPVVVFDVAEGASERAGIRKRALRAAIANRPFGYTHHVHSMGTDASTDRLIEAIAPYAEVKPY